jgi:succinoglycan biosynthesis transport protein ExoP
MERQNNLTSSSIWKPAGAKPSAAPMNAGMTPKEAMDIIRRHVLLISISVVVGLFTGAALWFVILRYNPKYTAMTYIEVLPPGLKKPSDVGMPSVSKDIMYQERASKATLINQQSLYDELLKRDIIRATEWFARYKGDLDDLREALRKNLGAYPDRDTNYVRVTMTCASPKEAALIVNEIVDIFVARLTTAAQEGVGGRLSELQKQFGQIDSDLSAAEKAIEGIRQTAADAGLIGATSVDSQFTNAISQKLSNLELQQNDLVRKIAQLQTNVQSYQREVAGPISPQIQRLVESDPVMVSLANQLSSLEGDLARRRGTLGDEHRDVKQVEEAIKRITEQRRSREAEIAETYRQSQYQGGMDDLRAMTDELKKLDEMRASAELKQKDLERYQILFEQSTSKRDELRRRKDDINNQITTYKLIYGDPETPQVRRAGRAPEPLKVSSPQVKLYLPGGLVLGFLVGVGLSFLIELLNTLVRTPSDVKKYLNTPLLGVIYHVDEDEQAQGVDMCHVIKQAPYSITSECYRQFRTNLKLSSPPELLRSILVTSGHAGDGKTCVASNLAATLVAEGKRVLFVDTNFRRPASKAMFPPVSEGSEYGLSCLLDGVCSVADVIRKSDVEGFDVIDAGAMPKNPAELLSGAAMATALAEFERRYDHVVIDGPPVLIVSEAKVLALRARSTVVVFNAAATTRGAAARTIRELGDIRANVVGCVLVQARSLKGGYFKELYKSYEEYQSGNLTTAGK